MAEAQARSGLVGINPEIRWARYAGYEVSTKGDRRFSAFVARMPDGRTIEEHYQCDVKGYQPGGTDWRRGKGKPAINGNLHLWEDYLKLWRGWARLHPDLMSILYDKAVQHNFTLSDRFASGHVNQARALATLLNERVCL